MDKKVYVGYDTNMFKVEPHFDTTEEAYGWIVLQEGYKDKSVFYKVHCNPSIDVDADHYSMY